MLQHILKTVLIKNNRHMHIIYFQNAKNNQTLQSDGLSRLIDCVKLQKYNTMNNMIGEGLCFSNQTSLTYKDSANETKDKNI